MKKLTIALGLTLFMFLVINAVLWPKNAAASTIAIGGEVTTTTDTTTIGPHGAYTANTNMCATCHSTHRATSPNLIGGQLPTISDTDPKNQTYLICTFCHNSVGQSKYDEVDGMIKDGDNTWASSAGGFEHMPSIEGANSYATTSDTVVTSKHVTDSKNPVSIPGGSASDTGKITLTCSSCHDPHGTNNARQLKTVISVMAQDGTTTTVDTAGITGTIDNPLGNEKVVLNDRINNFCGACHTDYLNTLNSGSVPSGTYTSGLYRHKVGMPPGGTANPNFDSKYFALPLSSQGNVTCLTCHSAHGSTAIVSTTTYDKGSTLLRMDERGVCQNCHRMTPSQSQPTIQNATLSSDRTKLIVTFDNYMFSSASDAASVTKTSNYTVTSNGGSNIVDAGGAIALQPNDSLGKTVVIPLSSAPNTNDTVVVTVINAKDLNGVTVATGANPETTSVPTNGYRFTFKVSP